jgi:hypothetical protein
VFTMNSLAMKTGFDPFRNLSAEERKQQLDSYLSYLKAHDGERDLKNKTLSVREARFQKFYAELDKNKSTGIPLGNINDYLDSTPPANTDPRLLWLLINAKANRGEKYGADRKAEELLAKDVIGESEINQYILLEEQYHTKILVGACQLCNFQVEIKDPPYLLRLVINQMLKLPKLPSDYLIYLGEIVGVHLFSLLLEKTELFSDMPELQQQLKLLVKEILADEVGHVVYCRTQIPGWLIGFSRPLVRLMGGHIVREIPEVAMLAGGKKAFISRLDKPIYFPDSSSWLNERA